MSDKVTVTADLAAIVTAGAALLTVVGNFIMQIVQLRRSGENSRKIDENTELTKVTAAKVDIVHDLTNHLKDQLVASTATIAHRDGVDVGVAQEAARAAAAGPLPVTIQNVSPIPVINVKETP